MGTIKDWLRKRKICVIKLSLGATEIKVLKKALKDYPKTATPKQKDIAKCLLGLIEYQEKNQ